MNIDIEGKEVDASTTTTPAIPATPATPATPNEDYFSLYYRKIEYEDFFNSLETSQIQLRNISNYIPIYESYFNMNETNYNSFNLNQRYYVSCLSGVVDRNNIQAAVIDTFKSKDNALTIEHKPVYIKFSPLLDPLKYLSGKYAITDTSATAGTIDEVISIPKLSKILPLSGLPKVNDKNNSSYVDGFFSYLSSQLLNHHGFMHGLDFYGSFNGIKSDFYYNVIDDIDYLDKNVFFSKNKDILFTIEDEDYDYGENATGYDSDDDDHISLDSMGKVKPRNNTRNRRAKIKIVSGGHDADADGDGGGSDSGDLQYIIHDDFNNISSELNAVFATTTNTSVCEPTCVNDINLESMIALNDLNANDNSILNSNIQLKDYHSDSDSDSHSHSHSHSHSNHDINNVVEHEPGCECNAHNNHDIHNDFENDDSTCSSRSSYTSCSESDGGDAGDKREKGEKMNKNNHNHDETNDDDHDDDDDDGDDHDEDEDEDEDEDYYDENETLWAIIKDFPVSAIMLEKCDNTLDSLMMGEEEMSDGEWKSALMQVIMTLITYQKVFGFTHNDLHTNNVMFVHTDKTHVYYLFNKKYYRVPTYHRIFKIIDFGRAIYKYKGRLICSDSFSSTGDAATQYNIEPYFNDKKPRLEPNFSFDLCRLGCSIFDYFIDNIGDVAKVCKTNAIAKLIVEWVTDDQNRNILYKTNGEERYPDFKLYKMIARSVHKHTPQAQLLKPIFVDYEVPKKKIKPTNRIMNIDKLPCYMD
jgi:hypothetical protein